MVQINGETQIIGFFGSTYKTSKMYAMYNAAFEALGLNYLYIPLDVGDLEKAIAGVRHLGLRAIGVTVPYKVDVVPYLDALDKDAERIGAVNAIVNTNGILVGANTDGQGAVKALQEVTDIAGKKVVLLGAGGAARSLAFAITDVGGRLCVMNRTEAMAAELAKAANGRYGTLNQLKQELKDTHILINATSIGMAPHVGESLVDKAWLSAESIVMDLVSHPKETTLLREAGEIGCKLIYGDRMLFWQGVLKFKVYTGMEPPVQVMEEALQRLSR
jgi:shikimate dehydrogenase